MCWTNHMAIPIVLKKPLRVYKVGTSTTFDNFISLFQDYVYHKCQTMPTVEINPGFERYFSIIPISALWTYDTFYIANEKILRSMVELVDTYALGAYAVMRVGSSPTTPTKIGLVCILSIRRCMGCTRLVKEY